MSRLAEGLSRFFGRVEIFARGADEDRRSAEHALSEGRVLEARAHARTLLARVPRSPLGLALWADAAEACLLADEVVEALSQLVEQVPWRFEVWLRLGQAGARSGWEHTRVALERAAAARDNPAIAREALLALADLDIESGEIARAQRWLDRVAYHPSQSDAELALRRTECLLALGRLEQAERWAEQTESISEGGRIRMVRAQLASSRPERPHGGDPLSLALAAFVLGARGSGALLAQLLSACHDAALVDRVRCVLRDVGHLQEPRWQAALSLAEGRREDARRALLSGAESGDQDAMRTLLELAVKWRDGAALEAVAAHDDEALSPGLRTLLEGMEAAKTGDTTRALQRLEAAAVGDAGAWAREALQDHVATWVPADAEQSSAWDLLLHELRRAATSLERLDLIAPIEALAVERQRPLYVAVLGEFNAGKSTLLNALLGTDVAPTGVRPTTASLHWVAWAPDPFARVVVDGGSDRVVQHSELKRTLAELHDGGSRVDRVFIYAPIERLKRIELLDTPGFNAPDTSHGVEARRGIEEAHVALWLLDATAPLKQSEREVIEQVAAAGVPIQVLVNKRDRVGADQIDEVMGYVTRALAEASIQSIKPPVSLSAQLALKGRQGDDDALAASGWAEVEQLLADDIVNRCDALRERALRRKAARVALLLEQEASQHAAEEEAALAAAEHRREVGRRLAARLRSQRASLAESTLGALGPALAALRSDARPIEALSPERQADVEVRAYMIDKTVERLSGPIADVIGRHARELGADDDTWRSVVSAAVRATVAGAAAAHQRGAYVDGSALRAAVEMALVQSADAIASRAEQLEPASAQGTVELRLHAVRRALAPHDPEQEQKPSEDAL